MAYHCGLSDVQTLGDWAKTHPDFAAAFAHARLASLVWWTKKGREGLHDEFKGRKFNDRQWQFMVRNLFPDEWRDEKHFAVQGILANLDIGALPPSVVARIASGTAPLAAMLEAATELAQLPAGEEPEPVQDAEVVAE